MNIKYVYVSGPLTRGNVFENINKAAKAGNQLMKLGFHPMVPHLVALQEMVVPDLGYEDYMKMDLAWIERCDAVLRIPGESPGGDREVAYAKELGIPVFYTIDELVHASWFGPAKDWSTHESDLF